jgi:hypothetical protein
MGGRPITSLKVDIVDYHVKLARKNFLACVICQTRELVFLTKQKEIAIK